MCVLFMDMCVQVCGCMWQLEVSIGYHSYVSPTYFLRQSLSLNANLSIQLVWLANKLQGSSSLPPQPGIIGLHGNA